MGIVGTNVYIIGAGGCGVTTEDLPAVLKDFWAQNGGAGKVLLKWVFNNAENLTGVQICYQAEKYPASPNDGAKVVVDNYTLQSVYVENLENGVEYFFRAYPYREIDGVKYFQTCKEACESAGIPNDIITPADLEVDGNCFVEIPKCSWADLGVGDSEETFPAFIIDGKEVDSIFIGKYCGDVENNKAISKKGRAPSSVKINLAQTYCENIGTGWHMMTRLEWTVITLWCIKNNLFPAYRGGYTTTSPTGSGGNSFSHDGTEDGIFDMHGVPAEFNGGIRFIGRELQIISRKGDFANDGANASIDQTNDSKYWFAIDGTTGELIPPDGKGTTENSVKANTTKWDIVSTGNMSVKFTAVTCADSICEKAKNFLIALGLMPPYDFSWNTNPQISGFGTPPSLYVFKTSQFLGTYAANTANNSAYYRPVFYNP